MKVILIQNVPQLGQKYDIKKVAPGYARNYLIPKNMAKPATRKNLQWLESRQELVEKQQAKQRTEAQNTAKMLEGKTFTIETRVGEKGQLFEHIKADKIAAELATEGFSINKKQIILPEALDELGKHQITIRLLNDLETTIEVEVVKKEE